MSSQFLRNRALYFWAALLAAPLVTLATYVWPLYPTFKSHTVGLIFSVASLLPIILLWLAFRSSLAWPTLPRIALIASIVLWSFEILLTQLSGSVFALSALVFPIVLLLIYVRPPDFRDVLIGGQVFAYALIAIALVALSLDALHLTMSEFIASRTGFSRIPILSDYLGVNARWEGPYGNVNYAAPVAGFLIIFSLCQQGLQRWVVLGFGILGMILSQGRSALIATLATLTILFLLGSWVATQNFRNRLRLGVGAGLLIVVVGYIRVFDPSLALRTDVWSDFLALWKSSPLFGVGSARIEQYVSQGSPLDLVPRHNHGHSILIDTLTRYGAIAFLILLLVLSLFFVVAASAARKGFNAGLGLVTFSVVAGLVETTFSWLYFGILFIPLILGFLLSASWLASPKLIIPTDSHAEL